MVTHLVARVGANVHIESRFVARAELTLAALVNRHGAVGDVG